MALVDRRGLDHAAARREPGGWELSPARRTPLVLHASTDNRCCCYRGGFTVWASFICLVSFLYMWFGPWTNYGSFQKNFICFLFLIELYVVSLLSNRFKRKPCKWDGKGELIS